MQRNLYFNARKLQPPGGEFIAWCDCMGTGRCLSRSLHRAANSVFKLHAASSLAQSKTSGVRCYPVMDGIYVTTPSRDTMNRFLQHTFCALAQEFVAGHGTAHMFMMRAGLAFGPTLHGADIPEEAFFGDFGDGRRIDRDSFQQSVLYEDRRQVLLSPAMVLAYKAERLAPPFGVYVDDSAKCYPVLSSEAGGSYISTLWQWWILDEDARKIATVLYDQISFYLDKAETHSVGMGYPIESIRRHRALAVEYFGGLGTRSEDAQQSPAGDVLKAAPEE